MEENPTNVSGFATRKVISLLKLIHNSYPGKERFEEVLNRPPPIHQPSVLKPEEQLLIKTDSISRAEIRSEAIRAGGEVSVEAPHKLLNEIWREEKIPDSLLRDEQAGFRRERSCTDQIATLRIIIEQSLECIY